MRASVRALMKRSDQPLRVAFLPDRFFPGCDAAPGLRFSDHHDRGRLTDVVNPSLLRIASSPRWPTSGTRRRFPSLANLAPPYHDISSSGRAQFKRVMARSPAPQVHIFLVIHRFVGTDGNVFACEIHQEGAVHTVPSPAKRAKAFPRKRMDSRSFSLNNPY
ncbi:hypothetical protein BRADI_4g30536v3 [Brachypodium distachyon]|uniref:Uncharacterized protein n=1 Tax=Brachypodium distachyon TaxID=15368 RepID=A0A2K2CRF3_BRADI|nr:hypothetical protein BRADI_4g30536v3 [Brachypodium distachyon]